MDKITVLILSSYFLAISPSLLAQQVSPNEIEQPVRFDKIVTAFKVKNPTNSRLTLDLQGFELSTNENNQEIVSDVIAENVKISPDNLKLAPNQEVTVRLSVDIPKDQQSRNLAVCTVQTQENTLGQQVDLKSKVILKNCMKVSGSRKEARLSNVGE